jgi:hypothetical protein
MSTIEQAEALVAKMTRGEKAQLLQHVAREIGDAYPAIHKPAACATVDARGMFSVGPSSNAKPSAISGSRSCREWQSGDF